MSPKWHQVICRILDFKIQFQLYLKVYNTIRALFFWKGFSNENFIYLLHEFDRIGITKYRRGGGLKNRTLSSKFSKFWGLEIQYDY